MSSVEKEPVVFAISLLYNLGSDNVSLLTFLDRKIKHQYLFNCDTDLNCVWNIDNEYGFSYEFIGQIERMQTTLLYFDDVFLHLRYFFSRSLWCQQSNCQARGINTSLQNGDTWNKIW